MKNKKKFFSILILCFSLTFGLSSIAFAGTLYTGPTYNHSTGVGGQTYTYHLSASSNTGSAPNRVVSNGFGQTTYSISSIEAMAYIYNSNNNVISSGYNRRNNSTFASVYTEYSGWPSGSSYCWGSLAVSFNDSHYGNFLGVDTSSDLYR